MLGRRMRENRLAAEATRLNNGEVLTVAVAPPTSVSYRDHLLALEDLRRECEEKLATAGVVDLEPIKASFDELSAAKDAADERVRELEARIAELEAAGEDEGGGEDETDPPSTTEPDASPVDPPQTADTSGKKNPKGSKGK